MKSKKEKLIIDTYLMLLNEKPLNKITVLEIVEKCDINRNTFYYHFSDIYQLTDKMLMRSRDYFFSYVKEGASWRECIDYCLDFILENKKAFYHLVNSSDRRAVENYLLDTAASSLEIYVNDQYDVSHLSEEDYHFIIAFYKYAFAGMLINLIENGITKEDAHNQLDRLDKYFLDPLPVKKKNKT